MNYFRIIISTILFIGSYIAAPLVFSDPKATVPWTRAFDFDGDGHNDLIEVISTGGAHCCYQLSVHVSSTARTYRLPFQLDGGYVGGLNLSQPRRFRIKTDKVLPELVMEIETYNGKPKPLSKVWKRKYGIKTHYVAVSFANGRLQVRDERRKKLIEQQPRLLEK